MGTEKDLVWLGGEVKSPPFTEEARIEAGALLRRLQRGENLTMPHSRPMPSIAPGCHELRIRDEKATWRIFYFINTDAIVLLEVASKSTEKTPRRVLENCKRRLRRYEQATGQ